MFIDNTTSMIFTPKTLADLLSVYEKNPEASIFAGGTWILSTQTEKYLELNKIVISLSEVEELKKYTRTEKYLEFSACTTLSKIANLKSKVVPQILKEAINNIATPSVRNLATIGGCLAMKEQRSSLYPVLMILDSRIELKKRGSSRWIDIRRFINDKNRPDILSGEIITRIRIPLEDWNFQKFKTFGNKIELDNGYIAGALVSRINKQIIIENRILMIAEGKTLFRPIQAEGNLISKKVPLSEKERSEILDIFSKELNSHFDEKEFHPQKNRFIDIFQWILAELSI